MKAAAARLRAEAEFTITQDLKRFRKEIEHEVIAAAMTQARKLLAERIGESDQRALADRYLASLATAPISADGPATPRGGAA